MPTSSQLCVGSPLEGQPCSGDTHFPALLWAELRRGHPTRATRFIPSAPVAIVSFALRQPQVEGSFQCHRFGPLLLGPPFQKVGVLVPCGVRGCAFALAQLPRVGCRIRLWADFPCTGGWGQRAAPSPGLESAVLGQFQSKPLSLWRVPSLGVRTAVLAILSPTPMAILQGQGWSVLWSWLAAAPHRDLGGTWLAPSRGVRVLRWQMSSPHHQTTWWLHMLFVFPKTLLFL